MEELDFKCGKCDIQFGLTEDYYCPVCKKLFCFSHIDDHGCNVELIAPKYITGRWRVRKLI